MSVCECVRDLDWVTFPESPKFSMGGFVVYQHSEDMPAADPGNFDLDTHVYTPGGDWNLRIPAHGYGTLWSHVVEFDSDCTPSVGVAGVVNVNELFSRLFGGEPDEPLYVGEPEVRL